MKRDSLFHPYAQGPKGENVGSITQPLPSNYLIFRAASESDGEAHVWLFWLGVYSLAFFLMNYFYEQNLLKPSLSLSGLSRAVLDGCLGAGSQLLQSLQADSQRRERRRYQHVFRVLSYSPPAAVYRTHWCRAATVSTALIQLQHPTYNLSPS